MSIPNNTPEAWNTGPITLDGEITVLAQYPLGHYWNGFLLPWLDALAVVTILEDLNATNPNENAISWDFTDDGALVLTELDWPAGPDWALATPVEIVERLEPDADGLYPLGAYAWVWTEVEPEEEPEHTEDHRVQEDHYGHHVVRYCKDCGVTL